MPLHLLGLAGSLGRPSRTRALVDLVTAQAAAHLGATAATHDLIDLQPSLGAAVTLDDLDAPARAVVSAILSADALVVGSPVYKGSYTGLFKHFFDLIEPAALAGKPVLLTATGGGEKHALVIGSLAATGLMLTGRWLQIVLTGLFVSPMIVPSIVIGVAFAYSFGRMGLSGSYAGLVIAHSILAAPLVFLSILTSLRGLDPDLDLAAASPGASRGHRFRHVTLPLAAPGFAAGALFAFTTSFDEVVVALFVASPNSLTLPVALFAGLRDRLQPTLVVVALLLSLISFAFLWLMARLQRPNTPQKH